MWWYGRGNSGGSWPPAFPRSRAYFHYKYHTNTNKFKSFGNGGRDGVQRRHEVARSAETVLQGFEGILRIRRLRRSFRGALTPPPLRGGDYEKTIN